MTTQAQNRLTRRFSLFSAIVFYLLAPVIQCQPAQPETYAKVMYVKGAVELYRQGETEPLSPSRGADVFIGDRMITKAASKAVLITNAQKMINLPANAELNIGQAQGQLIAGLGMGMFASGTGRRNIGAQAVTRDSDLTPQLIYPRNSMIRGETIVLQFAPLENGEYYEVKMIGVVPQFVKKTTIETPKLTLSKELIGKELLPGKAYFVYVTKRNEQGEELIPEEKIRVGMVTPETQKEIENVEKELQALIEEEKENLAYPTLLAETYEANYLYHDAIALYEKIYNELAPGDSYCLDRLKHLYTITNNPPALRILMDEEKKATDPIPFEWQPSPPSEQGFNEEKLAEALAIVREHSTQGLFVARGDRVVCEWYSPELGPKKSHYTASLAKALVGGMSLLLALNDGLIEIDDPAEKYISTWKDDPTRAGITIRHLATHSSGVEDAEVAGMGHLESGGWKSRFWKRDPDPFTIARDWAPMKFKPGAGFEYSNPGMALLSYSITVALQDTPHKNIRQLLHERIMNPIGVADEDWSIGYGKTYPVEGYGMVANWGGGSYTARAVARVGRLMLRKGDWQGQTLINPSWVDRVTTDAGTPDPYRGPGEGPCPRAGLAWWVNSDGVLSKLPKDAFMGAGAGNQVLIVVPSLDLIVVRFGSQMEKDSFWGGIENCLVNPLMDAIMK